MYVSSHNILLAFPDIGLEAARNTALGLSCFALIAWAMYVTYPGN